MGAVADAIRRSAESLGCEVRTNARVAQDHDRGRTGDRRGPRGRRGDPTRRGSSRRCIPKITFLQQLDRDELPGRLRRRHRELEDAQRRREDQLRARPAAELPLQPRDHRPVGRAWSSRTRSRTSRGRSRRRAPAGRRPRRSATAWCPRCFDRTLAPEGHHIISLFTQWVPHEWSEKPHTEELEAYADRVIAGYDELAPGFADSVLHRQVIGPFEMEQEWGLIGGNIFHGELSRRAAVPHAAGAGLRGLPSARSAVSTRRRAPPTAAAASAASPRTTRSVRSSTTGSARGARGGSDHDVPNRTRASRSTSRAGTRSRRTSPGPWRPAAPAGTSTTTC